MARLDNGVAACRRTLRNGMERRRRNRIMEITLTELEDAINYWRALRPSRGEERALSPEVNALATVYATMIVNHLKSMPLDSIDPVAVKLLEAWRKGRV
jgi:Protein of unknown function (DUF3717)